MWLERDRRRFGRDWAVLPLWRIAGWGLVCSVAVALAPRAALWPIAQGRACAASTLVADLAVMVGAVLGWVTFPLCWLVLANLFLAVSGLRLVPRVAGAALCLLAGSAVYLGVRATPPAMGPARMDAFARVGERAQPLIDALRAYDRDHGRPAPDLQALVPSYLPSVPGTGLVGYPSFRYEPVSSTVQRHRLDDGQDLLVYCDDSRYAWACIVPAADGAPTRKSYLTRSDAEAWARQLHRSSYGSEVEGLPPTDGEQPPPEGGWRLYVACSSGLGFDQFYYLPTERYPRYAHGGEIERLGRWAYVHE